MATESGTAAAVVVVATVVTPCDMARLSLKINSLSRPILYTSFPATITNTKINLNIAKQIERQITTKSRILYYLYDMILYVFRLIFGRKPH